MQKLAPRDIQPTDLTELPDLRVSAGSMQRLNRTRGRPCTAGRPIASRVWAVKPASGDFAHPVSPEEFRKLGHALVDWIADYQSMPEQRVRDPELKAGMNDANAIRYGAPYLLCTFEVLHHTKDQPCETVQWPPASCLPLRDNESLLHKPC